ncbi:hypothetical protein M3J09_011713 [Ascochyta lentis]
MVLTEAGQHVGTACRDPGHTREARRGDSCRKDGSGVVVDEREGSRPCWSTMVGNTLVCGVACRASKMPCER